MRFFCCCQGNTPCGLCPARPADFATRDYRIFIPAVMAGQLGKPPPPTNPNTTICPANTGFDHGYCAVHEPGAFQYRTIRVGWCPPDPPGNFCLEGVGPLGSSLGGVYSQNIVPWFAGLDEIGRDPANPFNQIMLVQETVSGDTTTRIQLGLNRRCDAGITPICSSSCANRMWISVGWSWFVDVVYTDCQNITTTTVLTISKGGTYVSDPFAGAFPETLHLKSASIRPAYKDPADPLPDPPYTCFPDLQIGGSPGDFLLESPCPLSYEPDGTLTPPFDIPTTIRIDRFA